MVLQIKLQLLREALTLSMCYAEALASDPANPRNSTLRFGEPQAQTPFVIHTHPIHEQVVNRFFRVSTKKEKHHEGASFLVDTAGVEPASENHLI